MKARFELRGAEPCVVFISENDAEEFALARWFENPNRMFGVSREPVAQDGD